jgi:hypothetical protein
MPSEFKLPYAVELANRGSAAFGQNPERHVLGTPKPVWVPVDSFETAAKHCLAYLSKHTLRRENWSGGRVRDEHHQVVARVDFDGHVHAEAPQRPRP